LRVAYLYLRQYPFAEALDKVRAAIKHYNAATNTPEALERGYHETMTRAWMRLVHFTLAANGAAATSEEFLDRHPELCSPKALNNFYSRERLISWQAKAGFVEPDIAPLPALDEA
jgi:hypothetical protein